MADRSFASRRSDAGLISDFPAMPALGAELPSFGFVLIGKSAERISNLKPLREALIAAWQCQISCDLEEQTVLIVLFAEPTDIAVLHLSNVLRLSRIQGRSLTSFAMQHVEGEGLSHAADISALTEIDIWWSGKRHRIKLNSECRLSLSELWDMPEIHVHPLLVPEIEASDQIQEQTPEKKDRLIAPRQALIPIKGAAEISFDDVLVRNRSLDERTQLKSIGGQIWSKLTGRKIGGEHQQQEEGPSVFANMAGWLLWHTPLGMPLAKQFAERMKLVERLMASGDVDSALRLALRLGSANDENQKKNYPTKLPGMRTSLNFNITSLGFSAPIIHDSNYFSMQDQYNKLAEKMERDGDFKRAAYIRAQLQGNHHAAVQTLARGELFNEAGKLAVDAKLAPALAIEMFYKAGEHETALAIAKREDCFDQLTEESRKKDPEFHAYILRAWTDRLIETNQPLRALQVTDSLANEFNVDPNLVERRLTWIDMIFSESSATLPSPEAVARALLSTQWNAEAETLTAFAMDRPQASGSRETIALDAVRDWVNDEGGRLSEFFDQLFRMANKQSGVQISFWKQAAPILIERVVLALISHSGGVLSYNQKDGLQGLLRKAGAEVLATDINKLKLQGAGNVPKKQKWTLPPSTSQIPTALLGCFVGNDTFLIYRDFELLQLLDPKGHVLWQGNVSNIDALIPVGTGSDVIIVQQTDIGKLLLRFSTSRLQFSTIGHVDLAAYHDITSDGQWLVQIGEQIGALDLAKLCAPQPEVEFLWANKLTASVEVISFLNHSSNPQWLTRDISDTRRNGLLEVWSLQNGRTLKTWLVNMESIGKVDVNTLRSWYWQNWYDIRATTNNGWTAESEPWTLELETKNCAMLQNEYARGQFYEDQFLSCDQSRAMVAFENNSAECNSSGKQKSVMIVNYDSKTTLSCLARSTSLAMAKVDVCDRSNLVLFAANDGRLILVDLNLQKVTLLK
jgi:hypothetical protein